MEPHRGESPSISQQAFAKETLKEFLFMIKKTSRKEHIFKESRA